MTMSMDDEDECGATTSWDNVPGPMQTQEWADWMGQQLQQQLVGLTARTSRAQVGACHQHLSLVGARDYSGLEWHARGLQQG